MNCQKCSTFYDERSQYCSHCGAQTIYNVNLHRANPNVTAVWLYAGYIIASSFFFKALSLLVTYWYKTADHISETAEKVSTLYKVANVGFLVLEIIVCLVIIFTIKNTSARVAVGIVAALNLIMFAITQIQQSLL